MSGFALVALVAVACVSSSEGSPSDVETPDGEAPDQDSGTTIPRDAGGTKPDPEDGGGVPPVKMVDCVDRANDFDVKCQPLQVGTVGSGPTFTGLATQVNHGFVSGRRLILAVEFTTADDEYGGIFSVDLTDGKRTLLAGKIKDSSEGEISKGTASAGKSLNQVRDVALGPNDTWIALAVQSYTSNRILFRIDPATGNQAVLFDAARTTCEGIAGVDVAFDHLSGLGVGPDGAMYVGLNNFPQDSGKGVAKVTPDGKCTMVTLSGAANEANNRGSGPPVIGSFLYNVTYRNDALYLLQFNTHPSILSIDPSTGDRTMISVSPDKGAGPDLATDSMAIGPDGTFYTYNAYRSGVYGLVSVDPVTGDRTALKPKGGPAKKAQEPDRGIWVHPDGKHLLLQYGNAILIYDPATGNSNTLSY